MEIFINKSVGEVAESVSVSGVKSVKDVLDLYKGMTLGENSCDSELLAGKDVNLTEFSISPWSYINELKERYKNGLGDTTYCLKATPTSSEWFDLTIGDIKILHKEFGEIIKFWEE